MGEELWWMGYLIVGRTDDNYDLGGKTLTHQ
jgi:hypothetical protein